MQLLPNKSTFNITLSLMHGLGIDIFKIVDAGDIICKVLVKKNQSKVANALMANTD